MSLEPRNLVCDGPDAFSRILSIGIMPINSNADGSPIYLTIDAEATVTGEYTEDDIVYSFSGSTSIDQLNRVDLRSIIGGVDIAGENYEITRNNDLSTWVDFGYITGVSETEFAAVQSNILGCSGGVPPFSPPSFYHAEISDSISGTQTDIDDVVTDTLISLVFNTPYFTGSIQDGDLKMVITLTATVNPTNSAIYSESFNVEIDCSSWTTLDFRDIRGTYGDTSYDINGIEYVWSLTIG